LRYADQPQHRVLDLQMRIGATVRNVEKIPKEEQKSPRSYKLYRARVIQPSKTLANKLALETSIFFECISWARLRYSQSSLFLDIFCGTLFSFIVPLELIFPSKLLISYLIAGEQIHAYSNIAVNRFTSLDLRRKI